MTEQDKQPGPVAVTTVAPPRPDAGRNWLRFAGEGVTIELDFDDAETCREALSSLGELLTSRRPTPMLARAAPEPARVDAPPVPAPVPEPVPVEAPKRDHVLALMRATGRPMTPREVFQRLPGLFDSGMTCGKFMHDMGYRRLGITKVGYGLYQITGAAASPVPSAPVAIAPLPPEVPAQPVAESEAPTLNDILGPEPARPATRRGEPDVRRELTLRWMQERGNPVRPMQIAAALPDSFVDSVAVTQFLAVWMTEPDCPIVKFGAGYYRPRPQPAALQEFAS